MKAGQYHQLAITAVSQLSALINESSAAKRSVIAYAAAKAAAASGIISMAARSCRNGVESGQLAWLSGIEGSLSQLSVFSSIMKWRQWHQNRISYHANGNVCNGASRPSSASSAWRAWPAVSVMYRNGV
jgi:hypothetical protein